MRKKAIFSAVCVAVIAVIGLSGVLLTNSKYSTTETGQASTSMAKWVFDVSGNDTYLQDDTIKTINLAQVCDETTLTNGQIAPGVSGSFDIVMDATDAEVGIDYNVEFSNIPEDFPKNLVFTVDGEEYDLANGFSGNIPANAENQVVTKTVHWNWAYETDGGAGDETDTADGIADSNDLTFDITVTGTQVQPVRK